LTFPLRSVELGHLRLRNLAFTRNARLRPRRRTFIRTNISVSARWVSIANPPLKQRGRTEIAKETQHLGAARAKIGRCDDSERRSCVLEPVSDAQAQAFRRLSNRPPPMPRRRSQVRDPVAGFYANLPYRTDRAGSASLSLHRHNCGRPEPDDSRRQPRK
jgi:hypothetical protein